MTMATLEGQRRRRRGARRKHERRRRGGEADLAAAAAGRGGVGASDISVSEAFASSTSTATACSPHRGDQGLPTARALLGLEASGKRTARATPSRRSSSASTPTTQVIDLAEFRESSRLEGVLRGGGGADDELPPWPRVGLLPSSALAPSVRPPRSSARARGRLAQRGRGASGAPLRGGGGGPGGEAQRFVLAAPPAPRRPMRTRRSAEGCALGDGGRPGKVDGAGGKAKRSLAVAMWIRG